MRLILLTLAGLASFVLLCAFVTALALKRHYRQRKRPPKTWHVQPGDDLQAVLHQAQSGDEIVLPAIRTRNP